MVAHFLRQALNKTQGVDVVSVFLLIAAAGRDARCFMAKRVVDENQRMFEKFTLLNVVIRRSFIILEIGLSPSVLFGVSGERYRLSFVLVWMTIRTRFYSSSCRFASPWHFLIRQCRTESLVFAPFPNRVHRWTRFARRCRGD